MFCEELPFVSTEALVNLKEILFYFMQGIFRAWKTFQAVELQGCAIHILLRGLDSCQDKINKLVIGVCVQRCHSTCFSVSKSFEKAAYALILPNLQPD
jgi:hypothetical protein